LKVPGAIAEAIDWVVDAVGAAAGWALGAAEWGLAAIGDAAAWTVGALGWLGDPLSPVGELLAAIWPPVLAIVVLVAFVRTIRWLLLLWRGRTPRVQITAFAWTEGGTDDEATWVTSLFREQLAALRLDALDPLPERAPGAPLVEIVEGVGQSVGVDIGKAIGRLFKAAWPDSGYEVWGTLRGDGEGGGRISVQLIERRRGNRTLINVALKEASWEEGARQAALTVAGALYPRVRQRERGPWTLWRRTVPRKLMGSYHAARRYEEENRLEHALAAYHDALDLDPLNPNLRLKIAMLQERLELDLDAWVTYEAIVDESDRRAWRGPDRRVYLLALYRLAVLLGNGRVAAQWVKRAWVAEGEGDLRDRERHERRRELTMSLECHPLFEKHLLDPAASALPSSLSSATSSRIALSRAPALLEILRSIEMGSIEPDEVLKRFRQTEGEAETSARAKREHWIKTVLQILSLRRLEELEISLRIRPPSRPHRWKEWWIHRPVLRKWLSRPEFARSVIRTSKLLVRLRIAASLEEQIRRRYPGQGADRNRDRWIREIRQAHQKLTKRWPFPPTNPWREALHSLAPRRRWANRRDDAWQLHYNGACTTASLLRTDSVLQSFETEAKEKGEDPDRAPRKWWTLRPKTSRREALRARRSRALPATTNRGKVVRRAIEQLEEYAYRAGSRRVAAQADWLAIDDPDFTGLRDSSEFKLWASHHLPRGLPRDLPTRKADVKRFTVRVVHEGALIFASSWRSRAEGENPTATEIVEWWRFERQVWEVLAKALREHLSWQERLEWLRVLQEWLGGREQGTTIDFSHEARGAPADSMTEKLFEEIADLASPATGNGAAAPYDGTILAWVEQRARQVAEAHEHGEDLADGEGLLVWQVEKDEALRAHRIWNRLASALEVELTTTDGADPKTDLRERLDRIRDQLADRAGA
jgi:hypothetical protein